LPFKEKYFAFKRFQYSIDNEDTSVRKRLKEKLSATLPHEELGHLFNAFDLVGDIAIIKTTNHNAQNGEAIGKQIMSIHRRVKSVFEQTSPITGEHRVRELNLLAGENQTVTKHKEAGCIFSVDVDKCYFSPRLSGERKRIASQVKSGETVVNMFSGVGCFSVIIAKTQPETHVYSIDVNPVAFHYMQENVRVNRHFGKVFPLLGDSKDIVETKLRGVADRVLMPLPELALQYLPTAVSALKTSGGWIHYYDFQHAYENQDPVKQTKQKVAEKLDSLGVGYVFAFGRVVRSTGPNWYQTVLDIQVAELPSKF
jgi:tRNA (guanine37-N1)-methyltransferase